MIENFERMVTHAPCTDEQMETFFYQLENDTDRVRALTLLETHRNELAKKIARDILASA